MIEERFKMSLENVKSRMEDKMKFAPDLNARYLFDFGDDGRLFLDASDSDAHVRILDDGEEPESDTTLACTLETFEGFLDGTGDPNIAYMTGKLKIRGGLGHAMKLNSVLED